MSPRKFIVPGSLFMDRRFPPRPEVRQGLLEVLSSLSEELNAVDQQVAGLVARRRDIVREAEQCYRSLALRHYPMLYSTVSWIPLPDEVPRQPLPRHVLRGAALREVASRILRAADRPMTLTELHRSLQLSGFEVPDPASRRLANALRADVSAGRVVKYDRGLYGRPGADVSWMYRPAAWTPLTELSDKGTFRVVAGNRSVAHGRQPDAIA